MRRLMSGSLAVALVLGLGPLAFAQNEVKAIIEKAVKAHGGAEKIDYRDLSVRQLGALYEGLLEYKLNLVANEPVVVRESGGKRVEREKQVVVNQNSPDED